MNATICPGCGWNLATSDGYCLDCKPPPCHGEGEIEVGTVRDEFGNWDTDTYKCPGCPDCQAKEATK